MVCEKETSLSSTKRRYSMNTENKKTRIKMCLEDFLRAFVENRLGRKTKHENYSVRQEGKIAKLIYTAFQRVYSHDISSTRKILEGEEEIAIRLETGVVLSNADRLSLCGSHMAFGQRHKSGMRKAPAQEVLENAGTLPIPFTVFKDAELDISQTRIIEKAPEETLVTRARIYNDKTAEAHDVKERRHFVGACLFTVGKDYWLFDVDREDLKDFRFNPFIVRLSSQVASIEEAYLSLKPEEVISAEHEGLEIIRMGEWFFIKRHDSLPDLPQPPAELISAAQNPPDAGEMGGIIVPDKYEPGSKYGRSYGFPDKELEKKYDQAIANWENARRRLTEYSPHKGKLRAGGHRAHDVEKFVSGNGITLVSGKVTHPAGDHRELELVGWWEPIPNKGAQSWTIRGEID